jgi:deoxyribodipyrimidine photo-lyase
MKVSVFWFRRDLRLDDNVGLYHALKSGHPVLPLFIFDEEILGQLPRDDARVTFIYERLSELNDSLQLHGAGLLVCQGKPVEVWKKLVQEFDMASVFTNRDYEPYAIERDRQVGSILNEKNIRFETFKDQVIFEMGEVAKDDGKPYTVFTPYKNKWLSRVTTESLRSVRSEDGLQYLIKRSWEFPSLKSIGFTKSSIAVKPFNLDALDHYEEKRNFPSVDGGSYLSPHLRFGTVSVRRMAMLASQKNSTFLNELIWREFFMQILWHFPHVIHQSFRPQYDRIQWLNNEGHFKKWCEGRTGYPMVDAGMRELNQTGYMHNRVRMVVASFLTKHLLIDWRWGEAYFAEKLLDYELSSNNGNWQWAAGTGCDAAPYFRVFNPTEQLKKFDPKMVYAKKWLGNDLGKIEPIVQHEFARKRALEVYKKGLASVAWVM